MADALDHAEKAVKKKAPAAEMEQPEKDVKKNWNGLDLTKALMQHSSLSEEGLRVGICVYSHQGRCKTGWNGHYLFHESKMQQETGFTQKESGPKKVRQGLKDLVAINAIEKPVRIRDGKKWIGKVIKWNFDYQTWKSEPVENEPVENEPVENEPVENEPVEGEPVENEPVINRIIHTQGDTPPKDYTGSPKDDTSLKDDTGREGAAAEPPPAPAFSAAAPEAPHTAKAALPEAAQGQPDLWGEPERVPEKPKGKRKKFIPPTLDEVVAEIGRQLEREGKLPLWTSDQIRNFAEDFIKHYTIDPEHQWENSKGKKIVLWKGTLATWLRNVDYLPPQKKNQLQGQSFQQTQERLAIESVIEMVLSGTATVEGLDITNPETIRYINREVARRRGYSTAP